MVQATRRSQRAARCIGFADLPLRFESDSESILRKITNDSRRSDKESSVALNKTLGDFRRREPVLIPPRIRLLGRHSDLHE